MITGDNPLIAAAIAREAGVDDFLAQATPKDKRWFRSHLGTPAWRSAHVTAVPAYLFWQITSCLRRAAAASCRARSTIPSTWTPKSPAVKRPLKLHESAWRCSRHTCWRQGPWCPSTSIVHPKVNRPAKTMALTVSNKTLPSTQLLERTMTAVTCLRKAFPAAYS
jgi:magnesium-transporting ATPase (P-type)